MDKTQIGFVTRCGTVFAGTLLLCQAARAVTSAWHVDLSFREYEGQAGGFEEDTTPVFLQQGGNASPVVRHYDVLTQTGVDGDTGQNLYGLGQDGRPDLSMGTRVMEHTGGRWFQVDALKRRNAYMGDVTVDSGTSRSGDHGIIAFEITLADDIAVSGSDFGVRVSSANGLGEIYEWTFVTVGGIDEAPFPTSGLNAYNHLVYNDLSNSSYFNSDGTVKPGGVPTENPLPAGKTISQFLAGEPAGTERGLSVKPGWFAMDSRNVIVQDGVETRYTSPGSGTGALLDYTVTGGDLGLAPDEKIQKFTVWFGYYDVAFDTDGDGYTLTNSNQDAWITRLSLGYLQPIPEPTTLSAMAFGALFLLRRRREILGTRAAEGT